MLLNTILFQPCRLEMFDYVEGRAVKWFVWFQASAAKYVRSAIIWDFTQRRVVIRYRRFGTTSRAHHQGSASSGNSMPMSRNLSVEMGLIGCPETSVRNCNETPREIPDKSGSQVRCSFVLRIFVKYLSLLLTLSLVPLSSVLSRVIFVLQNKPREFSKVLGYKTRSV